MTQLDWSENSSVLHQRGRREEAAARAVPPLAAPECALRAGLRFREWHHFGSKHAIAAADHADLVRRHHETIAFAAAPFAGGIAKLAARNPAVMGWRGRCKA